MPCPEPRHARRRQQTLFHKAPVTREGRRCPGESGASDRLECFLWPLGAPVRRRADQPRLRCSGRIEDAHVRLVCEQRLDEDVYGTATGQAEITREICVQVVGEERGAPAGLCIERRADHVRLHAAAPDRSDQSTFRAHEDRKSTRLNSSHLVISYAVFCLKKKKKYNLDMRMVLVLNS